MWFRGKTRLVSCFGAALSLAPFVVFSAPLFEETVAPIIEARCVECHTPSTRRGEAEKSHLYVMVHHGEMPKKGGPLSPAQIDIIRRHLADALDKGARAIVGGLSSIHEPYVDPVIVVDVPSDAALLQEETFGPVLPLVRVPDMDEAIRLANDSPYGLGATVFSRRHGMPIAQALNCGMVSVNSVLRFASVPSLPFGGRGESGFGRIHGADGLKEFLQPRAITRRRLTALPEFASFNRPDWLFQVADRAIKVLHGRHRR